MVIALLWSSDPRIDDVKWKSLFEAVDVVGTPPGTTPAAAVDKAVFVGARELTKGLVTTDGRTMGGSGLSLVNSSDS